MSSFGETLKAAREAKGLTCSQVAAQTHMLVQIVEEMEREDFHRIPAPIYGRGFVRLFADCVGLDPVPLVREFMDIYNGRRKPAPSIREVQSEPTPPPRIQPAWQTPPAPAPEPEPVPEPPAQEPEPQAPEPIQEPFAPEPEPPTREPIPEPPAPEPEPSTPEPTPEPPTPVTEPPAPASEQPTQEPVPEPQQVVRGLELFEHPPARSATDNLPLFGQQSSQQTAETQSKLPPPIDFEASPYIPSSDYGEGGPSTAERFRKGLSAVSTGVLQTVRNIPRRAWRMTALLLCAIVAILFIIWSFSKLYQATSMPQEATPEVASPVEVSPNVAPAPAKPAPTPAGKRPAALPSKPSKLISTGQNVPNLFID